MKYKELKSFSREKLEKTKKDLRLQLITARFISKGIGFSPGINQGIKTHQVRNIRKNIARINTILHKKEENKHE